MDGWSRAPAQLQPGGGEASCLQGPAAHILTFSQTSGVGAGWGLGSSSSPLGVPRLRTRSDARMLNRNRPPTPKEETKDWMEQRGKSRKDGECRCSYPPGPPAWQAPHTALFVAPEKWAVFAAG